jgi:hypothetical protein
MSEATHSQWAVLRAFVAAMKDFPADLNCEGDLLTSEESR